MGGVGSGGKFESVLPTSRDFVPCDIAELTRLGLFSSIASPVDLQSLLEVEMNGDDESPLRVRIIRGTHTRFGWAEDARQVPRELWLSDTSVFVEVTTSKPHFGGIRFWFVCPRTGCGRRCRVLYRARRGNARSFACRHCHRMTYQTQRTGQTSRLIRKLDRKADRFAVVDGLHEKPKGMHWRTYHRLCDEIDVLSELLWQRRFSRHKRTQSTHHVSV